MMPSEVDAKVGPFDNFAETASNSVSRAWFFSACVLLVVIWAPSLVLMAVDTSQLIINTATTIITFLLVALLQNSQTRANAAVQQKLNAVADGLADLMDWAATEPKDAYASETLLADVRELRAAVGLERREST
jgi:hypothetical protein